MKPYAMRPRTYMPDTRRRLSDALPALMFICAVLALVIVIYGR